MRLNAREGSQFDFIGDIAHAQGWIERSERPRRIAQRGANRPAGDEHGSGGTRCANRSPLQVRRSRAPASRQLTNILRVTAIFVASITASCSERSDLGLNDNSQTEEAKPGQNVAAASEKRTSQSESERSSTSEAGSAEAEGENELEPPEDEIAEDCVAFLRSIKTVPAHSADVDCPQCAENTESTEVLKFDDVRVDQVGRSGSTCEVSVTIHATFNPSVRESIAGGLTAWISPELKAQYLLGEAPSGQQVYKVKVIYRRTPKGWRAVEFDRP